MQLPQDFSNLALEDLLKTLRATPHGLTEVQVQKRQKTFGKNTLEVHSRASFLKIIANSLKSPLIILLLIAASISAIVKDFHGAVLILTMVALSTIIDALQSQKALKAAERLRDSVALKCSALRDFQKQDIPADQLVPGDIVFLSAGDLIPGDGRLIEAKDLFVNQSLLTGESYPVEKSAQDLSKDNISSAHRPNAVFRGTSVLSGEGIFVVCQTGKATALGSIAERLSAQTPPTDFEKGVRKFGFLIMKMVCALAIFVLIGNLYFLRPWSDTILFALALAVGLAPEFLPMVVSITLARGAVRLSRKKAIIKRLSSLHDLGSMTILCSDKTGTLTQAQIHLQKALGLDGLENPEVFEKAYLNSFFETGLKSPLDEAILAYQNLDVTSWRKIDELPFDFERRRVSVLIDNGKQRLLVVKGAPEDVLSVSTHFTSGEDNPLLTDDKQKEILGQLYHLNQQGLRVLGVACRAVGKAHSSAALNDENELTFMGFLTFFDPPKESAAQALEFLQSKGITLKIVTGDSDLVTQHLCHQLGIPVTGLLTGEDLSKMEDTALGEALEKVNLICRVTPLQKERVIKVLRSQGHTVGFIGDGINDAPSLHSASVALSVDSAADVAKDAADIILMDQDLNVVCEGVMEGRVTYGNIMKYIMMMTSSNFGNMLSMAGASLFLPFLPMLPPQVLLNNLLYDFSEMALPLDRVDPEFLEKPRKWNMTFIRNFMWMMGPVSSVFDFLTFYLLLHVFTANEKFFQTGWFVTSLATQILVVFIIRTRFSPFKSPPHPILILVSLSLVAIGGILPYTFMGKHFEFMPLPLSFFGVLAFLAASYLVVAEGAKRLFYRWNG